MPSYSFTIVIDGVDLDGDAADAVYGGGLDDATVPRSVGWQLVEVDRQAGSYGQALFSALRQLRDAVHGLRIVRVEPDGFLTLQDSADRTGRTRESVRLLISGERGPGGFPPLIVRHAGRSRLWCVRDVASWFAEHLGDTALLDERSQEVVTLNAAVNARLDLQRVADELAADDRRALADPLPLEETG